MIWKRRVYMVLAILIGAGSLLIAEPALACSVCAGDPNSALSQGAQAGMLVLLGVICMILTGLAALVLFWMRRAAQLEAKVDAVEQASRAPFSTA